MDILEQAQIVKFHKERIKSGISDLQALGWRSCDSQQKRFEVLLRLGNMQGKTVLDLGCGYGDFKNYIDLKYNDVKYIGIDIIPEFVNEAARRYTSDRNSCFLLGDFSGMELPAADFVIACGALCYFSSEEQYYKSIIKKMFCCAREAVAFNMLDETVFPEHSLLKAHNKKQIRNICEEISSNIKIIDGYLEDDFTVFIYK